MPLATVPQPSPWRARSSPPSPPASALLTNKGGACGFAQSAPLSMLKIGSHEAVMPAKTLAEAYQQARLLDAPLAERLEAYARASRELNKPLTDAVERLIARLKDGGIGLSAPEAGDAMPSFLLPDHPGRLVRLEA